PGVVREAVMTDLDEADVDRIERLAAERGVSLLDVAASGIAAEEGRALRAFAPTSAALEASPKAARRFLELLQEIEARVGHAIRQCSRGDCYANACACQCWACQRIRFLVGEAIRETRE